MTALTFHVTGKPSPKGSLKHVGKGRLVEQVKGSAPWRRAVAVAADREAFRCSWQMGNPSPVFVSINLYLPRLKSAPNRLWAISRSTGDVDKHARNILDALVDAGVIRDDSQVVSLHCFKSYAHAGDEPGATVRVETVGS